MSERLRVGIIMGSPTDLPTMCHVGKALTELGLQFGVDYEERVVSAHRTGEHMRDYAHSAEERGLRVIVAGAGGSAHLQGMVASETVVPVVGVAITSSPDVLNPALGSMIRMPKGKPLASFQGESGAFNAGLFAARILAYDNPELREAVRSYDLNLATIALAQDAELSQIGSEAYIEAHPA